MFKNRLLNTVAIPVLSMAVLAEPVAASAISYGGEKTQSRQAEEGLIQLAQAVVCSDGSEAADQESCNARDAQAAAQAQAEAEAQAAAQAQAEAEAQAAAQAQAEAEAQAAAQAQAEAEAQAAAQAQAEAEAQAAAQAQAEAEAQAAAQAQAEAEAQAAAQAQAEAEAQAAAQAEAEAQAQQQQAEAEAEAQRQAEAQAQADAAAKAEAEAQQPAEEAPAASVTCADGSTAATEADCAVPQPQQTEEQPAEEPVAPGETGEQPSTDGELRPSQDATTEQPATDGQADAPADGTTEAPQATGEQVPADGQAPGQTEGEAQPEQATEQTEQAPTEEVLVPAVEPPENQPVEELTDTRTEEEKQTIAEDPSQTTETVVLPVDNGAAVLDSDKDADNSGGDASREQRNQQRAQEDVAPPPESDADAQQNAVQVEPETVKATIAEEGTRLDAVPTFDVPTTVTNNVTNVTNITNNTTNNTVIQNNVVNQVTEIRVVEKIDNRTVINVGNQIIVRGDDRERLRYDSQETYYEELPRGRTRETIIREDGSRIVTVYNRYGDIVIRSRISPRGREYVLMYSPEADNERPQVFIDVGLSLPPMRLTVPVQDYIVSTSRAPDRDYYDFLGQPPVERVERVYSIDEVKSSARLRDKVRRIDLDTITFPSGSAEVPLAQAKTLRKVADAMIKLLDKDPGEVFLIEGHTDAVGADKANLVLSDQRASTVASLLSEVYGIPPENMSVQGYGERYLKIRTEAAEQQNRRVAIRRVTSLVRPANVSSND
jgi:outer membrane protein OmpA-like peptidoglycan-associated protein